MNDLSPEARRLFRLARPCDEPRSDALHRVESSLHARLVGGAAIATVGTIATKAAATAASTLTWIKLAASVGFAVAATGAGWWSAHAYLTSVPKGHAPMTTSRPALVATSRPAPMASPRGSAAVAAVATSDAAREEPTAELPAAIPPSRIPKMQSSPSIPAPSKVEDPLHAEIRDLRLAQQALRTGDGARVLSLLDEHEAAYSNGALQEERAAAKVLALCQVGRVDEARNAAERFEQRWPNSSLMARLQNSCWKP